MKQVILCSKIIFLIILVNSFSIAFWDTFPHSSLMPFVGVLYFLKKILCGVVLLSIPFSKRNLKPALVFLLSGLAFYIFTFAFFPKNILLFEQIQSDYLCCILAFCACVTIEICPEKLIHLLLISSRIAFCITVFVVITYIGSDLMYYLSSNYMFLANALVSSVAFMLYGMIAKKNIIDIVFVILGIVLLALGSRGALLSIVFLFILLSYQNKFISVKNAILLFCSILGLFFIYQSVIGDFDIDISNSRIFSFLNDSSYDYKDEDRFGIWNIILERSLENYLLPGGLCADRVYLNEAYGTLGASMYAHNFFIEMLADFGIVGVFFAFYMFYLFVYYLGSRKYTALSKSYMCVLFCISLFQLLFSRTLIREYNLYIFLAVLYMSIKSGIQNETKSISNNSNL